MSQTIFSVKRNCVPQRVTILKKQSLYLKKRNKTKNIITHPSVIKEMKNESEPLTCPLRFK